MSNSKDKDFLILRVYFFVGLVIATISLILLSVVGIATKENTLIRDFAILGILVGVTPIELVLGWPFSLTQKLLERLHHHKAQILIFLGGAIVLTMVNIVLFALLAEVVIRSPEVGKEMASSWTLSFLPVFTLGFLLILDRFKSHRKLNGTNEG